MYDKNLYYFDGHSKNILLNEVDDKTYTYKQLEYPTYGYLLKLIDYDFVLSKQKIEQYNNIPFDLLFY